MTKYHHVYEVNKIIKGYAVKYNKSNCHVHSLWYFNDERTELIICTDKPGIWVGKAGKDIAQLAEDLNKVTTLVGDDTVTGSVANQIKTAVDCLKPIKKVDLLSNLILFLSLK